MTVGMLYCRYTDWEAGLHAAFVSSTAILPQLTPTKCLRQSHVRQRRAALQACRRTDNCTFGTAGTRSYPSNGFYLAMPNKTRFPQNQDCTQTPVTTCSSVDKRTLRIPVPFCLHRASQKTQPAAWESEPAPGSSSKLKPGSTGGKN